MEESQHRAIHSTSNGCVFEKTGETEMKLTRILPKFIAKSYQAEDLRRAEIQLKYYQVMVRVLEERCAEGRDELRRLKQ
jgi:hypothetical protein